MTEEELKQEFKITEEQLKKDYETKLANLCRIQNNCIHDWEETKYDPEIVKEPIYETKWQGVDPYYEVIGQTEKRVDRWSRTCKKCGKIEYTKEQVAVKYEPKFN